MAQFGRRVRGGWNNPEKSDITYTHNPNDTSEGAQFICQLRALEEGEKYTVRARARNEVGWGQWSKKSGMFPTAKISGRFSPLFLRFSIGKCRNRPFFRAFY